jgi:leucyl/phenylalanyl-tRNA--protein transferase
MTIRDMDGNAVTPAMLLTAYRHGLFPMADHREGRFTWYLPITRAIITWDRYRIPRSLAKRRRQAPYRLTRDADFAAVIASCADRSETWISRDIEELYRELHRQGSAHSFEAWDGDELVGGLYGLAIGRCFSGESMFHRRPDAAKLCVCELVDWLRAEGYQLLDCQQQSPHLQRFGAYEVSAADYAKLLRRAAGG